MTLFFSLLLGFLAVRGFRFEVTETGFLLRNTESFLWLLLLVFFVTVLQSSIRESDRRLKVYAALYSFLISVFYCLGLSLDKRESFTWIWDSRSNLVNYLNLFFSYFLLYQTQMPLSGCRSILSPIWLLLPIKLHSL